MSAIGESSESKDENAQKRSSPGSPESGLQSNFGAKGTLAAKQAELDAFNENNMDLDKMKRLAAEARQEMAKELKNTAKQLVEGLTPGFITRMFNKKIHSERIVNTDASMAKSKADIETKMIEVKVATKKANKERKKRPAAMRN